MRSAKFGSSPGWCQPASRSFAPMPILEAGRRSVDMRYELYYWAGIQGRGEFVRLALEEAGADYADVAKEPGGETTMSQLLADQAVERPAFAPPFLKAGELVIGQTANILLYLGPKLG